MTIAKNSKEGPSVRNRFDTIKQNLGIFFAVAKINFDLTHVYKQKYIDEKKGVIFKIDLKQGSWQGK